MRGHRFRGHPTLMGVLVAVLLLPLPGSHSGPALGAGPRAQGAVATAAADPCAANDTRRAGPEARPASTGGPRAGPEARHAGGKARRAVHLLRRATYGVRPGDLAEVLRIGTDDWLDRQLHPARIDDAALEARLAEFPAASMSVAELYRQYPPPGRLRAALSEGDSITPEVQRELARRSPRRILDDLIGAKLQRAVDSERQLDEVMTAFWFNHFNIFFNKVRDRWLISDYERSAIQPHVFGTFEELLVATASHPAMLFYLDNWRSREPDSTDVTLARRKRLLARLRSLAPERRDSLLRDERITPERLERIERAVRRAEERPRGLNENYARELLELHTLGVDGGYTQRDVIDVARAFTGWTITRPRRSASGELDMGSGMGSGGMGSSGAGPGQMRFAFRQGWHDAGRKVVLGRTLPAGRGREDGLEVLHMLAHHPATARHIATKLVRHFVADDPPASLVERLATLFLETGGDLRAVTRALFTADEFYAPASYGAKIKRPFELVASALRVTGAEADSARRLVGLLRRLGQVPYLERAPTGYPTSNEAWVSSAAMLSRMNFALTLASGRLKGFTEPSAALRQRAVRAGSSAQLVAVLTGCVLPGADTRGLQAIVTGDLHAQTTSDPKALAARALGLILGSPEFQRR